MDADDINDDEGSLGDERLDDQKVQFQRGGAHKQRLTLANTPIGIA